MFYALIKYTFLIKYRLNLELIPTYHRNYLQFDNEICGKKNSTKYLLEYSYL